MTMEKDEFDASLDYIVEDAVQMLDKPYGGAAGPEGDDGLCEVIEKLDSVLILVDLSGRAREDVTLTVLERSVRLKADEVDAVKQLPCTVVPSTVQSDVRNGVMCVAVRKPSFV